jgi:hypothetical protein
MQLIPQQPSHFLPLLALVPLGLVSTPPLHLFLFGLLLLLRPSNTENYCNALVSVLLCVLLMVDNLRVASLVIWE